MQRGFEADVRDPMSTDEAEGAGGVRQVRIGLLPLPLFLGLVGALAVATAMPMGGALASGLLLPVVGGFALAELGGRIPGLRNVGLDTVLVLIVPSWLASAGLLPDAGLMALRRLLEATDAVGFFVTVLIVGSVMSIARTSLTADMLRLLLLLLLATAGALLCGMAAAMLLGRPAIETLALTFAPMMAGGLSAGAIPLSFAYADALGLPQGALLARMLPPLIAANLLAILFAGLVACRERRGDGTSGHLPSSALPGAPAPEADFSRIALACAGLMALHVVSLQIARSSGWAAPLIILLLSALLRLADPVLAGPRQDIVVIYRGCLRWLVHPVLFISGMLFTPWARLVEGFSSLDLLLVAAAVGGMALAGAALARPLGFGKGDGAVLALTRAGMGGTGTIAILDASRRLRLMPQAQILTRVGGAITLAAAMAGSAAFDF